MTLGGPAAGGPLGATINRPMADHVDVPRIALPLVTARLIVRRVTHDDAETLAAYRSDPEVARFQSWETPYPLAQARRLVEDLGRFDGPAPGEWVQLAVEHEGAMVGDVAVHLDEAGTTAEIGYTLARDHQGKGLAVEAVGAVVDALLDAGVHRIEAGVDPRNAPSRRVLEHLGFELEGVARSAFRVGDAWVDDERWSLLPADRDAWQARPKGPPASVRLVAIDQSSVRQYERLRVHPSQRHTVATVGQTFGDVLFTDVDDRGRPVVPWLRGIEADGEPVGLVLVAEPPPGTAEAFIWRFLVDRHHQGRGIGAAAVAEVVAHWRAAGCTSLGVSWVPGPGGPEGFWTRLGFVPTGEIDDGEVVARLDEAR